jgi:hypothetical protein
MTDLRWRVSAARLDPVGLPLGEGETGRPRLDQTPQIEWSGIRFHHVHSPNSVRALRLVAG